MSGGHWNYQSNNLRETAEKQLSREGNIIYSALADLEHILDWAESGDTVRDSDFELVRNFDADCPYRLVRKHRGAEAEAYDRLKQLFNELFPDTF